MSCCQTDKRLRLGRLRTKLHVFAPPSGEDDYGQTTGDYTATGTTLFADLRALTLREVDAARQSFGAATHEARTRYRPGMTIRHRVQHASTGAIYDVVGVDNVDDMNRVLRLILASQPDDPNV